ncbi:FAS1 domain-containing protein [Endogone sp. FLAS-F59071]|nr:FAS1 domain-containing protein [Endogone sp. FLAS-F59071]|eukprot:RUS13932.1 FAS1 domain-containing protein [Endogone sp. FLAS-F59071]
MAKLSAFALLAFPLLALAQFTSTTNDVATTTSNNVATTSNPPVVTTTAPLSPTPATPSVSKLPTVIPSTDPSYSSGSPSNTIYQNLAAAGLFLQYPFSEPKYAPLSSILNDQSISITFFAPGDAALASSVASGTVNLTKTENTTNIFDYHIGHTAVSSSDVSSYSLLTSYFNNATFIRLGTPGAAQPLVMEKSGNSFTVIDGAITANVILGDIKCSNGYLHIIDQVLLPPVDALRTLSSYGDLSVFYGLLDPNNVTGPVSGQGITIFAPSNEAWTAWNYTTRAGGILNREVKYHVTTSGVFYTTQFKDGQVLQTVSGQFLQINVAANGSVFVNGVPITQGNVLTSNGVIHIIPEVLDYTKSTNINMSFTTNYLATAPVISSTSTSKPNKNSATSMWREGVLGGVWGAIVVATVVARLII